MSENEFLSFPPGFVWGVATSAYQIEGAWNEDGRQPSIWDVFSHQPGRIRTGENGDSAADHYHRWQEDIALMSQMGLGAYRFSISWTRVLPQGSGAVNQAGIGFYDRLVDSLLEKGITPYPTLFHYDLPVPLHERGGWPNRDTAKYFGDYAAILSQRLSDRATCWITHNEPWVTAFMGYLSGEHAPGKRNPFDAYAAVHHLLLSHAYAVEALRANARQPLQVGIAVNLSPVYPLSPGSLDERAVAYTDAMLNRVILDPLLKGSYPPEFEDSLVWRWLERRRKILQPGDLKQIATPLDFVGVNYYSRSVVRYLPIVRSLPVRPKNRPYSQMWEIYPQGLYDLLMRLKRDYAHPNWIVTENGIPVADVVDSDGKVQDDGRISYLRDHLQQVHRAMQDGVPASGYFAWSLIDNFEWIWGYSRRFGLVYVDFANKARTLKESGRWYGQVTRQNGIIIEK